MVTPLIPTLSKQSEILCMTKFQSRQGYIVTLVSKAAREKGGGVKQTLAEKFTCRTRYFSFKNYLEIPSNTTEHKV